MNQPVRKAVAPVAARAAATTLIVRDGAPGIEVLMVRRSLQASFVPGAYVFPGGAVDVTDGAAPALQVCDETAAMLATRIGAVAEVGDQAAAFAVAALRECFEECGLWLGAPIERAGAQGLGALRQRLHAGEPIGTLAADAGLRLSTSVLQPFAHWVTPVGLPKRFDTLFLVAPAPDGQQASVDAGETTELVWVHPPQAVDEQARGAFHMEFATVQVMKALRPFCSGAVRTVLAHAAALASVPPIHPRLIVDADAVIRGALLPGQPGYEQAYGAAPR